MPTFAALIGRITATCIPVCVGAAQAAEHTLTPSPQTVHIGYFLASVKPVLTIESGDIVTIESAASIVPDVVDQSAWCRRAPCRSISATSTAR